MKPCPFCGGEATVERIGKSGYYYVACNTAYCCDFGKFDTEAEAIAAWNTRAELGSESVDYMLNTIGKLEEENERLRSSCGTLTAEQVKWIHEIIEKHWHDLSAEYDMPEATALPEYSYNWQAIADELNAELGSGKAKDLLLRTFGLAQMMYDCWLEECKAGDNVDVSACNAYSYEFDQIAQAMFDMGIDPNGGDYYRSAELGSGTCHAIAIYNMNDEWCGDKCSACDYEWYEDEPNFCPHCGRKVVSA